MFEWFGVEFGQTSGDEAIADECPFCEKDRFYLNVTTGQWKCHSENDCGLEGNSLTFVRSMYDRYFGDTQDEDYRRLKDHRGIQIQALKRNGLAFYPTGDCWLVPHYSPKKEVMNLLRYYPKGRKKRPLPGLPLRLFGLDRLSNDPERVLFVCEGAWDAIALDDHLTRNKTRARYDILAVPGAVVFSEKWLAHLKGRTVRLCLDNDEAGRKGQAKIAEMVTDNKVPCKLSAMAWPEGTPPKYDLSDLIKDGESVVSYTKDHCVMVSSGAQRLVFVRGDQVASEKTEWLFDRRIPFSTFVSLSGVMGTGKSTIVKDIVARATAGLPMPLSDEALVPPLNVLFFTSEDSSSQVMDIIRLHRGDPARVYIHDISEQMRSAGDTPIDLLDCLDEIETKINELGARVVVLDALNSFVGGEIQSDAQARRTLSSRLMALARRTRSAIFGVRNWGRLPQGTASQRSLGAASLADVARCVFNTRRLADEEREGASEDAQYLLEFEKVSGTAPPGPLAYSLLDCSDGDRSRSHLRRVFWRKYSPRAAMEGPVKARPLGSEATQRPRKESILARFPALRASFESARETVARNVSAKRVARNGSAERGALTYMGRSRGSRSSG